jgi:hypothetical protein
MHAHKTTVTIDERHEAVLRLPADFPTGEAEVIILSGKATKDLTAAERLRALDELLSSLPPAPVLPLSAFDRGEIYR